MAPKVFSPYQQAKADLLDRLGKYCCYCERPADLHIDHIVPKSRHSELEEDWTNLVLACVNCNATKGNQNESRAGYLWPDQDDTEAAFEYCRDGIVQVRNEFSKSMRTKAKRLFHLVGLGRCPAQNPTASDLRWRKRREAWSIAENVRSTFEQAPDQTQMVDLAVKVAQGIGFWSVWMAVFSDHPNICERLRDEFVGTASLVECERRRTAFTRESAQSLGPTSEPPVPRSAP